MNVLKQKIILLLFDYTKTPKAQMKIAIMQPYWFPFLGYFQLIYLSDLFVIYNDVQYIERGWINRNQFLINQEPKMISLPLLKASSSKKINEIKVDYNNKQTNKIITTIKQNYSRSPFFKEVFELFNENISNTNNKTIDKVCSNSFSLINEYLKIDKKIVLSSDIDFDKDASSVEKIIQISDKFKASEILFPSGSKNLYKSSDFENFNTKTVNPIFRKYTQNSNQFFPGLSIIDVLMNNSKEQMLELLNDYKLKSLDE